MSAPTYVTTVGGVRLGKVWLVRDVGRWSATAEDGTILTGGTGWWPSGLYVSKAHAVQAVRRYASRG